LIICFRILAVSRLYTLENSAVLSRIRVEQHDCELGWKFKVSIYVDLLYLYLITEFLLISSLMGSCILHGPHHSAKKSINTTLVISFLSSPLATDATCPAFFFHGLLFSLFLLTCIHLLQFIITSYGLNNCLICFNKFKPEKTIGTTWYYWRYWKLPSAKRCKKGRVPEAWRKKIRKSSTSSGTRCGRRSMRAWIAHISPVPGHEPAVPGIINDETCSEEPLLVRRTGQDNGAWSHRECRRWPL